MKLNYSDGKRNKTRIALRKVRTVHTLSYNAYISVVIHETPPLKFTSYAATALIISVEKCTGTTNGHK